MGPSPLVRAVTAVSSVGPLFERGAVIKAVEAEISSAIREERERCAGILEARAAKLEPIEGRLGIVFWKHGFLLGLASMIRTEA